MNVIIISAKYVEDDPEEILKAWFEASIREDRHKRRVEQINGIEKDTMKTERLS